MSIKKLKRLARLSKSTKVVPFEPKPFKEKDLFRPFDESERVEFKMDEPPPPVRKPRISRPPLSESRHMTPLERSQAKPLNLTPKTPKKKKRKPSLTADLECWFKTQVFLVYGDNVITKKWAVKERTLAKKLVETYGREMTDKVIKNYVEAWPQMVVQSRGRLYGLPTINFLWSAQDRFFGQAQIPTQPAIHASRTDEYREVEDDDDTW